MTNRRLQHLIDTDELDWDDPRHREMYLREWVNKDGHAFLDEDDPEAEGSLHGDSSGNDNTGTSTGNPRA